MLKSEFVAWHTALNKIVFLFSAFKNYFVDFRIDLIAIRFILENFKIFHIVIKTKIFVKIKAQQCRIVRNEKTEQLCVLHAQNSMRYIDKSIFIWKLHWNYMYIVIAFDSNYKIEHVLFISRDKISTSWWNISLTNNLVWLRWLSQRVNDFERYLVDLSADDDRLIHDIEAILQANSWKTQVSISLTFLSLQSIIDIDTRTDSCDTVKIDVNQNNFDIVSHFLWSWSKLQQSFELFDHTQIKEDAYSLWAFKALLELCWAK